MSTGRVARIVIRNNIKTKVARLQHKNLELDLRYRALLRTLVKYGEAAAYRKAITEAAFHLSYEVQP